MEISGKIIAILPIQEGNSKNGSWKKQSFILETKGDYPRKVCIDIWGDKIEKAIIEVGSDVVAYIQLSSREWNGKWFTDVKAWKIDKSEAGILSEPVKLDGMPLENEVWNEIDDDELPF